MTLKLQDNISGIKVNVLTELAEALFCWFLINILIGYYLSTIFDNIFKNFNKKDFYEIFDKIFNRTNIYKIFYKVREFLEQLTIKNFIKIIFKWIKNWINRIFDKSIYLIEGLVQVIETITKFFKYFRWFLNFENDEELLKRIWTSLNVFWQMVNDFILDISLLDKLIIWVQKWKLLIRVSMSATLFEMRIYCFLYFLFLCMFGIFLGFLLGIYKENNDGFLFFLLILILIMYNNEFDTILWEHFNDWSFYDDPLESKEISSFPLRVIEQSPFSKLKLMLKESDETLQIPFPIVTDPFIDITIDTFLERPVEYQTEFFKFYKNLDQKVTN